MRLASPEMYARVRGAAVRGGVKKRSQGGQISVLSVDQIRHCCASEKPRWHEMLIAKLPQMCLPLRGHTDSVEPVVEEYL